MEHSSDLSEFIGLFKRKARTLGEGFVQCTAIAYLYFFVKSFSYNMEISDFQFVVKWGILSFLSCVVSIYFYFIYDKYFWTRKRLLMRGISFLLVTVSTTVVISFISSKNWIPHLACAIYATIFMISIKKSKENIKTANIWLFRGFIVAILLFVCAGCLTWFQEMHPIKMILPFSFGMMFFVKILKHHMKDIEKDGCWGTLYLYWVSIITVGLNIGAIPMFFAWLGLPGLRLSNLLLLFIESACLLATTPFYIELIYKYREMRKETVDYE